MTGDSTAATPQTRIRQERWASTPCGALKRTHRSVRSSLGAMGHWASFTRHANARDATAVPLLRLFQQAERVLKLALERNRRPGSVTRQQEQPLD